ncbi:MAG: hypothetical protein NZ889_00465 [Candidatus Pacearchaeota archaeon]|nr:hypothetical protein [Candidatus Pacearchaeota archaeon]
MKNKRGQITFFVIIALVVVTVVLMVVLLNQTKKIEKHETEIDKISSFIYDCVKTVGNNAAYTIGQKGGYLYLPDENVVAIYVEKNQTNIPSKEMIEKSISQYINEELYFCTKNFIDFKDIKVIQKEINTTTEIRENEFFVSVNYPITIEKNNKTSYLQFFNVTFKVRLGFIYGLAVQLAHEANKESLCVSCIFDIAAKNNLTIDIITRLDKTIIYSIIDHESLINGKPYEFIFGVKK